MEKVIKENIQEVGKANIKVVGVGGGGGNAVNQMITEGYDNVEYYVINTDGQALDNSKATRILIGQESTKGLGAGANPEIGKRAAEENEAEIRQHLEGADLIYIAAGMGGGTGTGAAPIVAKIAKELGVLTIGVVTLPFFFEGPRRMKQAIEGKRAMSEHVDTLITIPNDKIAESVENQSELKSLKMTDAYALVDSILVKATAGVTSLIQNKGHINLDFADIQTVIRVGGSSVMGTGKTKGENAASLAAQKAIENPLFVHSIVGARGIIMNFKTSENISFFEIQAAATEVQSKVSEDAVVIFGHVVADEPDWEEDEVEVTMVATGFEDEDTMFQSRKTIEERADDAQEKEVNGSIFSVNEPVESINITPQEDQVKIKGATNQPAKSTKTFLGKGSQKVDSLSDLRNQKDTLEVPAFLRHRG